METNIKDEKDLREIATAWAIRGDQFRKSMKNSLNDDDYPWEQRVNFAVSQGAFSCEEYFKAPIVYRESKNKIVGFPLADKYDKIDELMKNIQSIRKELSGDDRRKNVSLTPDELAKKQFGHNLHYLYTLLPNKDFALLNYSFMTNAEGDEPFNYIVYGLLFDSYLDGNSLKMSQSLMDGIMKNCLASIILRYPVHSDKYASEQDLEFVKNLSNSLHNINNKYYFRSKYNNLYINDKKIEEKVLESKSKDVIKGTFMNMDPTTSLFLNKEFSESEVITLIDTLEIIRKSYPPNEETTKKFNLESFLELAVYIKHTSREAGLNIVFDEKIFEKIRILSKMAMDIDITENKYVKLEYDSYFINNRDDLTQRLNNDVNEEIKENKTIENKDYINQNFDVEGFDPTNKKLRESSAPLFSTDGMEFREVMSKLSQSRDSLSPLIEDHTERVGDFATSNWNDYLLDNFMDRIKKRL